MKKILLISLLIFSTFSITYANENTVKVTTSEKIPWVDCEESKTKETRKFQDGTSKQVYYDCKVKKWASNIAEMMWAVIKYFTFIAGIGAVLFIVINGIMYSMWWIEASMKDEAKKRIIATLIGLALLMLSAPILNIIAPWVYK